MTASHFHVVVVSPDEIVFEGESERLIVPGVYQDLAILPNHTPLYAQLKSGVITVFLPQGLKNEYSVESGIIRVKQNQVSVLIGFETRETVFKT